MSITTRAGKGSALTHVEMDDNLGYLVPPGAVMAFARNTPPTGWLECNGQAISRTTYADLFAALGTAFGSGNGSTTFNLPNLLGEFIRGWDHGRGVDSGRAFASSQAQSYQSHNHTVTDPGHGHSVNDPGHSHGLPGGSYTEPFSAYSLISTSPSGSGATNGSGTGVSINANTTGITVANSGSTETRPRNIAMLYCIKV